MLEPDLWKMIMGSSVWQMFTDKQITGSEKTLLLFSIETPIDSIAMNLDTQKRTGGCVMGNQVIFGD